jgi:hypothetical protein
VVVGEEVFGFLVEAATFQISQCAGKKARHVMMPIMSPI